jgi:hypothetical protein
MMEFLSDTEANTWKNNVLTINKILRIMQQNNAHAENQILFYILINSYIYSRNSQPTSK